MDHIVKDPLLAAATVATWLARIALAVGTIGLAAAFAAALLRPDLLVTPPIIGVGLGKQEDIPIASLATVALTIAAFALLYGFAASRPRSSPPCAGAIRSRSPMPHA